MTDKNEEAKAAEEYFGNLQKDKGPRERDERIAVLSAVLEERARMHVGQNFKDIYLDMPRTFGEDSYIKGALSEREIIREKLKEIRGSLYELIQPPHPIAAGNTCVTEVVAILDELLEAGK